MSGIELTEDQKDELRLEGWADPVFFAKFYFPEWFPKRIPWVHRGIAAILTRKCGFLLNFSAEYTIEDLMKIESNFVWRLNPNDPQSPEHKIFNVKWEDGVPVGIEMEIGKFTLVMLPRGFSKTTWLNVINIYSIVYHECKFPNYISKTAKHASRQLRTISKQLSSNARLRAVFGELKAAQRNDEGLKWSESDGMIQMTNGVMLAAVGMGGSIRGTAENAQRPDRLCIDDIEDKENTKTDERRADTRAWFFGDLLPALPKMDDNATATMLCNAVHADSIGFHLMQDPRWTVVKFGAEDKQGDLLWPDLWSTADLEAEKRSYALQGELATFYLEYYNEIRAVEKAKFKNEYIHILPRPYDPDVIKALAIDPAISEKAGADFCAFGVVEMYPGGITHLRDVYMEKGMSPAEQVDKFFELAKLHKMQPKDKFGVESIAYQAALIHLLRSEMFRRGFYFEITPITHGAMRKTERVEGIIQPRYANGFVTHQRHFPEYVTQLLDWPLGKKDGPDVVAMAVSLLDDAAPLSMSPDKDPHADEYEPLAKVFGGDWRKF